MKCTTGTRLFGDGLAVWYTKDRAVGGPVFGNQDKFIGMGLFFDTYSNLHQGHSQYISVMFGDGLLSYDHDSDGGDARTAGCPLRFRLSDEDEQPVHARIIYQEHLLRVYIDTNGEGQLVCVRVCVLCACVCVLCARVCVCMHALVQCFVSLLFSLLPSGCHCSVGF